MNPVKPLNIVITGPESTGKTELAKYLYGKYKSCLVPEYAREYIEKLTRTYNYQDVIRIAEKQIRQQEIAAKQNCEMVILDTWLIITKIWFVEVFGKYPSWMDSKLKEIRIDLYLLCATDIPWIPDPVRENGGERRDYLFTVYLKEIEQLHVPYYIVTGKGMKRFKLAEDFITKHFNIK